MADPRGDDGIGELRKLVTSLAQTVGHLDASYKSVQQTLDEIRSDLRDLRAGGVNWLGILGLVLCQILGPFAIMKGNQARAYAYEAGVPVPGTATAGLVLGWITTILLILTLGLFCMIFGLAALGGA